MTIEEAKQIVSCACPTKTQEELAQIKEAILLLASALDRRTPPAE